MKLKTYWQKNFRRGREERFLTKYPHLKKEFKNIYIKCVEKYNNEYFRGNLRKWHGELKFNLGSNFVKNLKIK